MSSLPIWTLGLINYVVLATAVVCGWWRWSISPPKFGLPKWRTTMAFCGLLIGSVVGIAVSVCSVHVHERPWIYLTPLTVSKWGTDEMFATALALLASLISKGPARLPACLASVGLVTLWITIPVIAY